MKRVLELLFAIVILFPVASSALDLPVIKKRVNDHAGMLTKKEVRALETKLKLYEDSSSTQLVLLTIPSLEGENLEDFSQRTAEKNGIGQKGKDNGVLLLVVKKDRKMRIEVGYGLEPVLTDALSKRIIEKVIKPEFKEERYYSGIDGGFDSIIKATTGEFDAATADISDIPWQGWVVIIVICLIILFLDGYYLEFAILGAVLSGGGGSGGSSWSGGGGSFGGGGASGSW